MRLLISVRSLDEARAAADAGTDLLDLKEPRNGALGALSTARIGAIAAAIRASYPALPVSATTGQSDDVAEALRRVEAVAAAGVDYVKVGMRSGPGLRPLLRALAARAHPVVPVFLCDEGIDHDAWGEACRARFAAVMIDTEEKATGSLFDRLGAAAVAALIAEARAEGKLVGVAGALAVHHVPLLRALAPDLAGFRTAVCAGDRTTRLDARKVRALGRALRGLDSTSERVRVLQ